MPADLDAVPALGQYLAELIFSVSSAYGSDPVAPRHAAVKQWPPDHDQGQVQGAAPQVVDDEGEACDAKRLMDKALHLHRFEVVRE